MGTGAELLPKMLLGGGLGALGGALSDDPSQLTSFIGQTGETGMTGINTPPTLSIDPGDLLAQGLGRTNMLFDTLADQASRPTTLGPAAMIQSSPFIYGGALPGPMGIGIVDPGFQQRPGLLGGAPPTTTPPTGGGGLPPGGTPLPPADLPPTEQPDNPRTPGDNAPGGGPPNAVTPPRPRPGEDRPGSGSYYDLAGRMTTMDSPLGMTPTPRGELDQFLDAMNLASLGKSRPLVRGGL